MLVWIVGKDGLVGKSMMSIMDVPHIGSSHKEADVVDLESLEAFFLLHKPTHIVNCAAIVEVDKSEGEFLKRAEAVNIDGAKNLAKIAKKYGLKLIHISTDYVFDGTKGDDYIEEDQVHPINRYGKTKLLGEQKILQILDSAVILRTASLFGSGKYGLIDSLVELLQNREECSFVTDQISSPTYVDDLARATVCLLEERGIFHFVNGGFCSRYELLVFVKELMEKYHVSIKCIKLSKKGQKDFPRPAIRPVRSVLSTKKIEPFLDFSVRSWKEAVESFFVSKWGKNE